MSKLGLVLPMCIFAVACGDNIKDTGGGSPPFIDADTGIDSPSGSDAGPADAAADAAPTSVTISGTVERVANTTTTIAGSNATVDADKVSDDSVAGSDVSNGSGDFTITIASPTFDGYLHATIATFLDTYFYPAAPFDATTDAPVVQIFNDGTFTAYGLTDGLHAQNLNGSGFIELTVVDDLGDPVSGATVAFTPGSGDIVYDPAHSSTATSTGSDGLVFIYNTTATGNITLSATKSGTTFTSHDVKARTNSVTQTIIAP